MRKHIMLAAVFLLLPASPLPAWATESAAAPPVLRSVQARSLKPSRAILSVVASDPSGVAPLVVAAAARGSGQMRLISVGGAVMTMEASEIRDRIASGAFIVVDPVTLAPWAEEDRTPAYPPYWF
jgi:hypothetical protein